MKLQFFKKAQPVDLMSPWYGMCWNSMIDRTIVLCPIPFNWPLRLLRMAWYFLRHPMHWLDGMWDSYHWRKRCDILERENNRLKIDVRMMGDSIAELRSQQEPPAR